MKTVHKAYVFKLRPNRKQVEKLWQYVGAVRYVYNRMLSERKEAYESREEKLKKNDQINELVEWKKREETAWLKEIHAQVLQQAVIDLDRAYTNFFERHKSGVGYPKYKKRKIVGNGFRYPQGVKVEGKRIYLPKIGWMRFRKSQELPSKIKSVTVKQKGSGWYVSILCEVEVKPLPKKQKEVGVDVGSEHLAVTSDEKKHKNPRAYRRLERKLGREQRKLAKKVKGSANWYKQAMKVARIHERIHNIRANQQHQVSWEIVSENQVIYVEDLHVKGMVKNRKLSKSIQDAGMAGLLSNLAYKSDWYGRIYHAVDRWYPSSKTCSVCGYRIAELPLGVREWQCKDCETIHDRDINAAKNILAVGQTERQNACGERVRPFTDGHAR